MQTVLIVTDDGEVAGRLAELVAGLPCDVALAADGGRARHLMEVLAFDVILVDAGCIGLDPVRLAAELRRAAAGRPRPRLVAMLRSPERMLRGFDAHVTLAAADADLARALLTEAPHAGAEA